MLQAGLLARYVVGTGSLDGAASVPGSAGGSVLPESSRHGG
jgi:hypothetical protein